MSFDGPHLRPLRRPCQLVGFRVPLGLRGDRGASEHCRLAVVQSDAVVGEPGAEGLASASLNSLRKAALPTPAAEERLASESVV